MDDTSKTVIGAIAKMAVQQHERHAIATVDHLWRESHGTQLTYGELWYCAHSVSAMLVQDYGVQRGQRVLLLLPAAPAVWHTVALLGCQAAGAVPIIVDTTAVMKSADAVDSFDVFLLSLLARTRARVVVSCSSIRRQRRKWPSDAAVHDADADWLLLDALLKFKQVRQALRTEPLQSAVRAAPQDAAMLVPSRMTSDVVTEFAFVEWTHESVQRQVRRVAADVLRESARSEETLCTVFDPWHPWQLLQTLALLAVGGVQFQAPSVAVRDDALGFVQWLTRCGATLLSMDAEVLGQVARQFQQTSSKDRVKVAAVCDLSRLHSALALQVADYRGGTAILAESDMCVFAESLAESGFRPDIWRQGYVMAENTGLVSLTSHARACFSNERAVLGFAHLEKARHECELLLVEAESREELPSKRAQTGVVAELWIHSATVARSVVRFRVPSVWDAAALEMARSDDGADDGDLRACLLIDGAEDPRFFGEKRQFLRTRDAAKMVNKTLVVLGALDGVLDWSGDVGETKSSAQLLSSVSLVETDTSAQLSPQHASEVCRRVCAQHAHVTCETAALFYVRGGVMDTLQRQQRSAQVAPQFVLMAEVHDAQSEGGFTLRGKQRQRQSTPTQLRRLADSVGNTCHALLQRHGARCEAVVLLRAGSWPSLLKQSWMADDLNQFGLLGVASHGRLGQFRQFRVCTLAVRRVSGDTAPTVPQKQRVPRTPLKKLLRRRARSLSEPSDDPVGWRFDELAHFCGAGVSQLSARPFPSTCDPSVGGDMVSTEAQAQEAKEEGHRRDRQDQEDQEPEEREPEDQEPEEDEPEETWDGRPRLSRGDVTRRLRRLACGEHEVDFAAVSCVPFSADVDADVTAFPQASPTHDELRQQIASMLGGDAAVCLHSCDDTALLHALRTLRCKRVLVDERSDAKLRALLAHVVPRAEIRCFSESRLREVLRADDAAVDPGDFESDGDTDTEGDTDVRADTVVLLQGVYASAGRKTTLRSLLDVCEDTPVVVYDGDLFGLMGMWEPSCGSVLGVRGGGSLRHADVSLCRRAPLLYVAQTPCEVSFVACATKFAGRLTAAEFDVFGAVPLPAVSATTASIALHVLQSIGNKELMHTVNETAEIADALYERVTALGGRLAQACRRLGGSPDVFLKMDGTAETVHLAAFLSDCCRVRVDVQASVSKQTSFLYTDSGCQSRSSCPSLLRMRVSPLHTPAQIDALVDGLRQYVSLFPYMQTVSDAAVRRASLSVSRHSVAAEENFDDQFASVAEFRRIARSAGLEVLKFVRGGDGTRAPKKTRIFVDAERGVVHWGNGRRLVYRKVTSGKKSRVLRRVANLLAHEDICLSFVAARESKVRTLDIACRSRQERDIVVRACNNESDEEAAVYVAA